MDSLIPPITTPNLTAVGADRVVSGEIENLPADFPEIKPGQSLLLKVLMTENPNLSSSMLTSLKVNFNNQTVELPLDLKLDIPLELPQQNDNQIAVKITSVTPEKIEIKLVSVNNDPPAKFISAPNNQPNFLSPGIQAPIIAAPVQSPTVSKPQEMTTVTAKPLIVDTGKAAQTVSFHALELPQIIENIVRPLNLPLPVINAVNESFQGAKIEISLNSFVPETLLVGKQIQPNPVFTMLSQLDEPLQHSFERLRLVISNFSEQVGSGEPSPEQLDNLVNQIKNEILPFKNSPLSGEAISKPDNQLMALKTVIGNVLPDTSLKTETGVKVVLEIKNIIFPEKAPRINVADLMSSAKLVEDLASLRPLLNSGLTPTPHTIHSLHSILTILEPLKEIERPDLSAKIIAKFPSFNDNMIPNMVNFIKGAMTNDLEAWLSKAVVKELHAAGVEGQEVANRLNGYLNATNREGISWRMVEIPFFSGDNISKIRVAIKKFAEDEENNRKPQKDKYAARFVVDTSFSVLGEFQFDGFSFVKDRRFDLIIRTSKEVGDDLYANILRLFKTTLSNLDYSGNVKINVKENFIKVCEDEVRDKTLKNGIYI